jgi:membrane peptidoglycan carboxypeptidase
MEENETPIRTPVGEDPSVNSDGLEPKWRNKAGQLFLGFLKGIFFTLFYLSSGTIAFGLGIGWHYFDETESLELSRISQLENGAIVLDARGKVIGRIGSANQRPVSRLEIPSHFIDALIAAEDQRFLFHPGFDPAGALRAAWANYRAETIREGASTLTQQLAREVFELEGKHADRKLLEIAAAVRIEQRYSKDEILVYYLNRIYFGSGFYGLGSAARGYFGKQVSELTVDESAMLCGVIPSPSRYSPFVDREKAIRYRDQTLNRMYEIGKLTREELASFLASKTEVAEDPEDRIQRGQESYLIGRIERELRDTLKAGGREDLTLEGITVETSIDLALQQTAAKAIHQNLARIRKEIPEYREDSAPLQGAFVMLENATGRIVISVGSYDYQRSEYDRAIEMKRPPGSAIFPFLYATAFESGRFRPDSLLSDSPFDNRDMGVGGIGGVLGEWSAENPENRWTGKITVAEALRQSKNSPTARLGLDVGIEALQKTMRAAGVKSPLSTQPGSLLGMCEVNLTEMTRAYSVFPNEGRLGAPPRLIISVKDAAGKAIPLSGMPGSSQVIGKETAATIRKILARSEGVPGSSGKSGTTSGFTDAWFFGFDPEHTWGTWIGKDTFTPIDPQAFGGTYARPVADAVLSKRQEAAPETAAPVVSAE